MRLGSLQPLPSSPPLARLLGGAALLALVVSTQFLFQPFIWRHWPASDIALGWTEVLRDRAIVCAWMAGATWSVLRGPAASQGRRDLGLALAVAAGAILGELSLMALQLPAAAEDLAALLERALRWCVVALALLALHRLRRAGAEDEAARRQAEREHHAADAHLAQLQLMVLRAQIEPHFLFNTLATVHRLATTDRARGILLLDRLVDFVRLSARAAPGQQPWTVGQEMALVRAYLGVIEMRMDGRLSVLLDCETDLEALACPPLLLGTLVENAVRHGITPMPAGGRIEVAVRRHAGRLEFRVADTGVGFAKPSGTGIGLSNLRARLETLHGSRASLSLTANVPQGVVAVVRMPCAGPAS